MPSRLKVLALINPYPVTACFLSPKLCSKRRHSIVTGLRGAAVCFDAQVEFAERLVLENVLSAVAHGATVLTYARVEKLIVENAAVRGVEFTREFTPEDRFSGATVMAELRC